MGATSKQAMTSSIALCVIFVAPTVAKAEDQQPPEIAAASLEHVQPQDGNPDAGTDEIIVTARRRVETLSDAPVALTVFDSQAVRELGMTTLEDVTLRTPGVQFSEQATLIPGRVNTSIRFRGMDTNQPVPSQQVGTLFLDGIYVATGVQSLDLDSLERIEIIKGPQSATFGRSTFGGAINYVMKTPSFSPQGRVNATIGEDGLYDVSLTHEGPVIADVLAYRANVRGFGTGGQYRSVADGGRLGQERTLSGNLTLYAEPTSELRMKLRGFYGQDRDGQNDGIFLGSATANFGAGPDLANCNNLDPSRIGVVPDYFCGNVNDIVKSAGFSWEDLVGNNTTLTPTLIALFRADTAAGRPKVTGVPRRSTIGLNRDQLRLAASTDYTFPESSSFFSNGTLSFLAGYNRVGIDYVHDFDHAPAPAWLEQDPQLDEDHTLELRYSSDSKKRLRYSIGVSNLEAVHEEGGSGGVLVFDYLTALGKPTPIGTPTPTKPVILYSASPTREKGSTWGVFGYLGYDISRALTLDFEWRWQIDRIQQGAAFEAEFKNFLPRLTLSYSPTSNGTAWATYSKGNLPGFFNPSISGLTPSELEDVRDVLGEVGIFNEEEELKNYELGWRQSLLRDRVQFSLVGYYMQWRNQKTRSAVTVTNEAGALRLITLQTNAGNSELWGFELESQVKLEQRLTASLSFNYARSQYQEFDCPFANFVVGNKGGRIDCAGKSSPKFPKWKGAYTLAWNDSLTPDWDYFLISDGSYSGRAYNEEANFSYIGDTFITNMRLGVQSGNVRLEAFVTNLLDNDDLLSASRTADFSTTTVFGFLNNFGLVVTPPEKRQFGLRAIYEF